MRTPLAVFSRPGTRRLALLLAVAVLVALAPPRVAALAQVEVTPFPGETGTVVEHSGDGLVPTFRYAGASRFDTASLIVQDDQTFQAESTTVFTDSDTVLIARADLFPDALAGNFLAGAERAPILLVSTMGPLETQTVEALEEIDPERVVLLGSTAAISQQVADDLAADYEVDRVGGRERIETAALIAETGQAAIPDDETRTAIVASAVNFPDALVAGALSYAAGAPLLLTQPDTLSPVTAQALEDLEIDEVVIPGGTTAVSQAVQDAIEDAGIAVTRAGGPTRVDTAVEIADLATGRFGFTAAHVNVARGDQFPDALTIGPHAGEEQAVLLLTQDAQTFDSGDDANAGYLEEAGCELRTLHLAGGQQALSLDLEEDLRTAATATGDACDVVLTPQTATNLIGESHTVTAAVSDNGGLAAGSATVRFTVETVTAVEGGAAGIETQTAQVSDESATVMTSETGTATFTFRGLTAGSVQINACVTDDQGLERCGVAFKTFSADALLQAVTTAGITEHLAALDALASLNPDGEPTRAAGTDGYQRSVDYIAGRLRAAGYSPTIQPFDFVAFQQVSPSDFAQTAPSAVTYPEFDTTSQADPDPRAFNTMDYSASGNVTAPVTAVDIQLGAGNASTSGCEPADYAGFPTGNIALVQRGVCTFNQKVFNAQAVGASGVIIFNQGNTPARSDIFAGTLGAPTPTNPAVGLPVFATAYGFGAELVDLADNPGGLTLRMFANTLITPVTTFNILAETPGGDPDNVVMVGAHLDSVLAGPGINDNGSGSAAILEVAEALAELGVQPANKLRFAWWGAEEAGLVGSEYYVSEVLVESITAAGDIVRSDAGEAVAMYLNFDMVGSPNFARFVYDGDQSTFVAPVVVPDGSAQIDQLFTGYFGSQGLASEGTEFNGRSDYQGFIDIGVPAGGLFTGAEGAKTAEQAVRYGGTAGQDYDACYHRACDTLLNVNLTALDQMSDAIAFAVLSSAASTDYLSQPSTAGSPGGGAASGGAGGGGGLHADHGLPD